MVNKFNSNQEQFWAEKYANEYIKKNSNFNHALGADGWNKMLAGTVEPIHSYLECGCNIGRNIHQLNIARPNAKPSIIEISKPAYDFVVSQYKIEEKYNGSILSSNFNVNNFDLVFTMGVLIHINPDQLLENLKKMYDYSRKYILIGEYFNRTPVSIRYQDEDDKLFKMDFGKLAMNNLDVKLIDYGFLWGHIYDDAGFDDFTWWLFEKNK